MVTKCCSPTLAWLLPHHFHQPVHLFILHMQSTHPTIIIFTIVFLSFFHHLLTHQVKARNKYAWRQSGCSTSSIFGHACTAQSCSESFLQHFDDAVITFIRQRNNLMNMITALLKHYYKDSEQLLVVHVRISSWCNYKPLLPWPSSHTKSGGSKKKKVESILLII